MPDPLTPQREQRVRQRMNGGPIRRAYMLQARVGVQLIQGRGHPPGRLQPGGRAVACRSNSTISVRARPPWALLVTRQPQGLGAAALREVQVAGRGGGEGGGIRGGPQAAETSAAVGVGQAA